MQLDNPVYFPLSTDACKSSVNMIICQKQVWSLLIKEERRDTELSEKGEFKADLLLQTFHSSVIPSQLNFSRKESKAKLDRTNPAELKRIVRGFKPPTPVPDLQNPTHKMGDQLWLKPILPLYLCGPPVDEGAPVRPLTVSALLNSPPKAPMELSGAN